MTIHFQNYVFCGLVSCDMTELLWGKQRATPSVSPSSANNQSLTVASGLRLAIYVQTELGGNRIPWESRAKRRKAMRVSQEGLHHTRWRNCCLIWTDPGGGRVLLWLTHDPHLEKMSLRRTLPTSAVTAIQTFHQPQWNMTRGAKNL